MYSQGMWKLIHGIPLSVVLIGLTACQHAPEEPGYPNASPASQSISPAVEKLYMAHAAAPQHSAAQRGLVEQMAEKAGNGKELLLTMRVIAAVFPTPGSPEDQAAERRVRALVAEKMVRVATLEQLHEYAMRYAMTPVEGRAVVERMLQLAGNRSDPQTWNMIKRAARSVKADDLAQKAQAQARN
jgi:hypothetical protein